MKPFKLEPGSLTEAMKGWNSSYAEMRRIHDRNERKMIDAFGPDLNPYF